MLLRVLQETETLRSNTYVFSLEIHPGLQRELTICLTIKYDLLKKWTDNLVNTTLYPAATEYVLSSNSKHALVAHSPDHGF